MRNETSREVKTRDERARSKKRKNHTARVGTIQICLPTNAKNIFNKFNAKKSIIKNQMPMKRQSKQSIPDYSR
jgi:hypothetical protein